MTYTETSMNGQPILVDVHIQSRVILQIVILPLYMMEHLEVEAGNQVHLIYPLASVFLVIIEHIDRLTLDLG